MDATEELPTIPADERGGRTRSARSGDRGGSTRPAEAPAHGPAVLGRYRLGPRLGSGGFGTVYAAHDERLDRDVAVKVIPAGAPAPERASREAFAAARLDHPGIVAVFDAGEDDHARYLVSELVRGRTLDRLAADGELSDRDVLRVGLALAGALEHAHGRGVIHRDVKPQNVIVPDRPRSARSAAKLTDFGVAHLVGDEALTHTGDVVGTLAYMAPEQAAGQRVDERADLYSLALVLYEGLAGKNPVRGPNAAATARKLGSQLPSLARARKELPAELTGAIDRALLPRPEDRGELEDLAGALAGALPEVSDDGGTILAHPLERSGTPYVPPLAGRIAAALAAGGIAAAAITHVPHAPVTAPIAGAAAATATALLPRAGWLAAAAALTVLLAPDRPGAALVLATAAAAAALSRGTGRAWSLPAAAPLLALVTLAAAYPALAGRARHALQRAALGAAGAWCFLLTTAPGHGWEPSADAALHDVIEAPFRSGLALIVPAWALAALVLPWLVRGRNLSWDFVAASTWAAGLGAGTDALARWAGSPVDVTAGALTAWALALMVPRLLPLDSVET